MARNISLRKWDYTPNNSRNIVLETKISDLGNPIHKKSILGYFFSIAQGTNHTDSTPAFYSFQLSYRTSLNKDYIMLGNASSVINGADATKKSLNKVVNFSTPIKDILQIQLKVTCILAQGDFSINDFGIMYRDIRSSSVEKHDEE